ncbi:hypothetical protein [Reyranella sp.]|uniref:hypothetical protein n=1 Tax=Reyranella sp. TaxID=1929291 RepID=UPI003783942F
MPQVVRCSICRHPKRHLLEVGLTYGVPHRALAARYECSPDALQRHAQNHLSAATRAAILANRKPTDVDLSALRTSEAEGLLGQLISQRARLQQHADFALSVGNTAGAVAAERTILSNLETVGKLLGTLAQHHTVTHTSVLVSADYLKLRQVLITALRPFPDAARAVGTALAALESEAAADITARATVAAPTPTAPLVIEHVPEAAQ